MKDTYTVYNPVSHIKNKIEIKYRISYSIFYIWKFFFFTTSYLISLYAPMCETKYEKVVHSFLEH